MEKLLIIDGNSIANRAYYALPFLSNHKGEPSGAVFGFANILIKLISQTHPSHIIVAFDHARRTFRNDIYQEYKMQRKPSPHELLVQFPAIKDMLKTMGISVYESSGIEADDIIGTICKSYSGEKFILSGDRDLLQLIDDNTSVWLTKKGVSEVDKVDEVRLKELFNLKPYQIIELKGLMGDSSDNIPGVKGVGEKTALTLLEQYGNIENIYKNIDNISGKLKDKLIQDKHMAFLSKTLATIKTDCDIKFDIDECKFNFPFSKEVFDFFNDYDFSSITRNSALFDFSNTAQTKEVKIQSLTLTKDVLDEINLNLPTMFCYDLKKMQFIYNDKIYFLSANYGMFENAISFEEFCRSLKNIFENDSIVKVTKDAKNDMHLLSKFGISLNNYFDLNVADYILNAGLKTTTQELPLEKYASHNRQAIEEINRGNLKFIYEEIEKPLVKILFSMEEAGFKLNEDKLNGIDDEFSNQIENLTKQIYLEAGEEFNINSPKQVAYILFEKLGIKTYNNKKQSTSADILNEIRYIPIVDNILTYRKYAKIKNTYIDVYKKICQSDGDVIHTTFNQTLTSTGRLSSSEPNLQNIPTRDDVGKNLRKIFISKFANGKIISADYNQIELRLLADMSGEEELIQSYRDGKDIHAITASQIFNVPLDEVTESERRDAKAVNFGIIYGISDYGLSQNIKSTRAKAKDYINSYFTRYPLVKQFMDNNVAFAREKGYAITKFGRIRKIPEISSSKFNIRTFGERVAMNMPLQGTASDIIKLAMIKVYNAFKEANLKSHLILQIHDELIVDTFPGEEEKVKDILKYEMENVATLKVPLVVSIGIGESLYDCK